MLQVRVDEQASGSVGPCTLVIAARVTRHSPVDSPWRSRSQHSQEYGLPLRGPPRPGPQDPEDTGAPRQRLVENVAREVALCEIREGRYGRVTFCPGW